MQAETYPRCAVVHPEDCLRQIELMRAPVYRSCTVVRPEDLAAAYEAAAQTYPRCRRNAGRLIFASVPFGQFKGKRFVFGYKDRTGSGERKLGSRYGSHSEDESNSNGQCICKVDIDSGDAGRSCTSSRSKLCRSCGGKTEPGAFGSQSTVESSETCTGSVGMSSSHSDCLRCGGACSLVSGQECTLSLSCPRSRVPSSTGATGEVPQLCFCQGIPGVYGFEGFSGRPSIDGADVKAGCELGVDYFSQGIPTVKGFEDSSERAGRADFNCGGGGMQGMKVPLTNDVGSSHFQKEEASESASLTRTNSHCVHGSNSPSRSLTPRLKPMLDHKKRRDSRGTGLGVITVALEGAMLVEAAQPGRGKGAGKGKTDGRGKGKAEKKPRSRLSEITDRIKILRKNSKEVIDKVADASPVPVEVSQPGLGKGCPPPVPKGAGKGKAESKGKAKEEKEPRKPLIALSAPLKNLRWNSFRLHDRQAENIWTAIDRESSVAGNALQDHIDRLTVLFSEKVSNESSQLALQINSGKVRKLQVIGSKRRRQLSIMLAVLPDWRELCEALESFIVDKMTREKADLLLLNAPTDDEVALLERTAADNDDALRENTCEWDAPEEFLLLLISVPQYKLRLRTFEFESSFVEDFQRISAAQQDVTKGCDCLLVSPIVKHLLASLLTAGNILNAGTKRGRADGFSVEALDIARSFRTTNEKEPGNLVDFIVEHMECDHSHEIAQMCLPGREAEIFRNASRHSVADINADLQSLSARAWQLLENLRLAAEEELCMAPHMETLRMCIEELSALEMGRSSIDSKYAAVKRHLHMEADDTARKCDELLGVWSAFAEDVRRAYKRRVEVSIFRRQNRRFHSIDRSRVRAAEEQEHFSSPDSAMKRSKSMPNVKMRDQHARRRLGVTGYVQRVMMRYFQKDAKVLHPHAEFPSHPSCSSLASVEPISPAATLPASISRFLFDDTPEVSPAAPLPASASQFLFETPEAQVWDWGMWCEANEQ